MTRGNDLANNRGRGNRPATAQGHTLPRGGDTAPPVTGSMPYHEFFAQRSEVGRLLNNPQNPGEQERQQMATVGVYQAARTLENLPDPQELQNTLQRYEEERHLTDHPYLVDFDVRSPNALLQLQAAGMTSKELRAFYRSAVRNNPYSMDEVPPPRIERQRPRKAALIVAAQEQFALQQAQVALDLAEHPSLSQVGLDRSLQQSRDFEQYIASEAMNRTAMHAYGEDQTDVVTALSVDETTAKTINEMVAAVSNRRLLPDKPEQELVSPQAVYLIRKGMEEGGDPVELMRTALQPNMSMADQQQALLQAVSDVSAERLVPSVTVKKQDNGKVALAFHSAQTEEAAAYRTNHRPAQPNMEHNDQVQVSAREFAAFTPENLQQMMGNAPGQADLSAAQLDTIMHASTKYAPSFGLPPQYYWEIDPKNEEQVQLSLQVNQQLKTIRQQQQLAVVQRRHEQLTASLSAASDARQHRLNSTTALQTSFAILQLPPANTKQTLSPDSLVELMTQDG